LRYESNDDVTSWASRISQPCPSSRLARRCVGAGCDLERYAEATRQVEKAIELDVLCP